MAPAIVCVETLFFTCPGLRPAAAAALRASASDLIFWLTYVGFVASPWSSAVPEYGWPRYSVAVASYTWLPPSVKM